MYESWSAGFFSGSTLFSKRGIKFLKLFMCLLLRLNTVVSINDFGQVITG